MTNLKYAVSLKWLVSLSALVSMQTVLATPNTTVNSAFEQAGLIGKVFHDHNGNGYLDDKEQGIPGVRLFTIEGLMIETDAYGRFHVAGFSDVKNINLTNSAYRQKIILKIDQASLPDGSNLTTENPRVVRLGEGGLNKVNFGVYF